MNIGGLFRFSRSMGIISFLFSFQIRIFSGSRSNLSFLGISFQILIFCSIHEKN